MNQSAIDRQGDVEWNYADELEGETHVLGQAHVVTGFPDPSGQWHYTDTDSIIEKTWKNTLKGEHKFHDPLDGNLVVTLPDPVYTSEVTIQQEVNPEAWPLTVLLLGAEMLQMKFGSVYDQDYAYGAGVPGFNQPAQNVSYHYDNMVGFSGQFAHAAGWGATQQWINGQLGENFDDLPDEIPLNFKIDLVTKYETGYYHDSWQ